LRKGRGAASNRESRYSSVHIEDVDDGWPEADTLDSPRLRTVLHLDQARLVISRNDSPDLPFDRSINPYRGCEHGCIYCYARPTHAYLGLSPGLDFETQIFHKPEAPERLAAELARRGYRCAPIALGTNTDPWQPVERRLGITRGVLQVLQAWHHPLSIVTKSALLERDLDLLAPMAAQGLASVVLSFTTLRPELARRLEPRTTAPARRLRAISAAAAAGVPVGVFVAPVIPGLTDDELETILASAREAGASWARYTLLRLPLELESLFGEWLREHYPERAQRIWRLLNDCHGGRSYDSRFGVRQRGRGPVADLLAQRFELACRRLGLGLAGPTLDCGQFRAPDSGEPRQLDLF
jgi:DNA repair photolyase